MPTDAIANEPAGLNTDGEMRPSMLRSTRPTNHNLSSQATNDVDASPTKVSPSQMYGNSLGSIRMASKPTKTPMVTPASANA